ncbi:hypothetical protein D9M71_312020 [compost metagenome]
MSEVSNNELVYARSLHIRLLFEGANNNELEIIHGNRSQIPHEGHLHQVSFVWNLIQGKERLCRV